MISPKIYGQDSTLVKYPYLIEFPIFDFPYNKHSSYENPSMQQGLQLTKSLHAGNYYINNRLWANIISTDTRSGRIWNRIAANASSGLVDLLLTYEVVVFSPQWQHEEFHRNGLSLQSIPSYNETYNRFNGGQANGSVSKVRDEDMIA